MLTTIRHGVILAPSLNKWWAIMLKHVNKSTEEYYVDENGIKQGEFKSYYSNGQIYIICNYVNGEIHGEFKSYYQNGDLRIICNYVNGEIHGEYESYHDNGQIYINCNYVNGEIHGEYKQYYSDGELYKHFFYNMDKHVDLRIHGMDIDNLSKDDINLLRVIYA